MALLRAAGRCRLTLRTQWASLRLLSAAATGGEPPAGEDRRRQDALEALRRERALRPPSERAPPVSGRPRRRLVAPTREQLQLNKDIQACASAEAVLALVSSRLDVLNEVNAATALMTLARRASISEAASLSGDARFVQLIDAAAARFALMAAQELSNTLYACGQLGITPPADWLERFWHASALKVGEFIPQALSNTVYSCGLLGIMPPADWLERYWHASAVKLGAYIPQDYSNTLYACGRLGLTPPGDWLERFWQASAATLDDFVPQALSNAVYACGQLGLAPPVDWLERFWHASASKLGEFKPQELSNTLYACGRLGLTPPGDWLERFWHASAATLGDFDPQAYSNTLYACGQLAITPPARWLERYWHASAATLGDWNTQDFSITLYACGQLGITPPADWLQRFWHASATILCKFKPQDFSNTIYACGLLDSKPAAEWLQLLSSAFEQALPAMNQQHLANTAVALTMLGLWELPLWHGLWERLCSSLSSNIAGWSAEDRLHAMQMYQAYQAAALERPGLLSAPEPELLAAARKSWIDGLDTDIERNSQLHDGVSACLTRMGVAHANERWCERAERSIDIVIDGAVPVALEVDGPSHFLQDGRPNGRTLLRDRMLAAHGWRVVTVGYRAWNAQHTQEQREEYLRSLLA